ncbi:PPE family protein [Mycobacterium spongiae]|uniref:PPE domain-containing protein n=1 Tax=Mycobacterium spongiae TaxID=886343 RepID=A0A975JZY9_9MYCO|nr:PPE family protein [Mycobacterium spongiae]QUR68826.1 PPE domain-containing protein [Mycobacterium spongiae]
MDFGLLPPEVTSGLMYSGPGPESLLAAAAAWEGVAAEMSSAAVSYGSVVSTLINEPWIGAASGAMAAAATPYVGWLATTAAHVKETATQARIAAAAYETAFAMMVPPPVIAANRARLMSLVATNLLGQNSAAIAATQAEYAEMWAQDAAAMYGYEAESAAASALTAFIPPARTSEPGGVANQAAAVAKAAAASAAANAGQALAPQALGDAVSAVPAAATDPLTSALSGILANLNPQLANVAELIPNPELDAIGLFIASIASGNLALGVVNTARGGGFFGSGPAAPAPSGVADSPADEPAAGLGARGGAVSVSAGAGHASGIGALSVPHSWTTAAPEIQLAVQALPSASASPTVDPGALNGMPMGLLSGMALASMAARGTSGSSSNRSDDTTDDKQDGRKPPVVVIREPPPPATPPS